MKIWKGFLPIFAVVTTIVILGAPAFSASSWIASYCGMDNCSWTRITEVNKVQANERGTLFRVQEQTCHKTYPGGNYPKTYACRPKEIEVTSEAVYCSTQSPRFAYHQQNKWVIQHLSFDEQHNYHAIQWDNRLYFLVCHNHDIGDGGYNLDQIAKRFGYHPISTSDDIEVDAIEEVAPDAVGFIFTADRATNLSNENETVRLLERLPAAELKKRFSRYKVDVTAGEDCVICATVSKEDVSIMIDYDKTGIVIVGISSNDNKATDALGNGVGSSLRSAIGASANCEAGMQMTCASPRLIGLHYVVEDLEKCPIVVKEKQATEIPLCARIGGFQITAERQ
jgi:hypothetical protein